MATICITPFEFCGFTWNSAEHLLKYLKYGNDMEAKKFIVKTKNPRDLKVISNHHQYELHIYKEIPNFNLWRCEIMLLVNTLKTLGNQSVQDFLKSTNNKNILELTDWMGEPNDTFWGVIEEDNSFIGRNFNGKCWMKIRSALLNNTLLDLLNTTIQLLQKENILPTTC